MSLQERLFRILLVVVVAIAAAVTVPAVAQVVGATIAGTVHDSTGATVNGATVTVRQTETGVTRILVTGADGRYAAPSVPVGDYTVSVTHDGFQPQQQRGIALAVGQSVQVNFTISVSTVHEQVVVDAGNPVVNITSQQDSGLVDERQVKELPLNGRSYDQLITLNPATVNYTGQRSGSIGTSNSSVGNMFSASGRRPQDNLFLLNGVEYTGASLINVTPGGTSGQLLGVDAVREFNVVTDTYGAEYGKRDGAQVSIVTTGGTDKLHGSVYDFERNSYFDARNYFDGARIPEFQRDDFGASLGGPIRKDHTFLFANYEGFRQNLGESLVTLVPDYQASLGYVPVNGVEPAKPVTVSPVSKQLLNLWPLATPTSTEVYSGGQITGIASIPNTAPQNIREDFGTARFDQSLTTKDSFTGVYTVDDSSAVSPSADPYSYVSERLREQVLSGEEKHTFNRAVNVARVGYSRASYYFYGYVPAAEQALVPSIRSGVPTYAVVIAGSTASNGASSITTAGANVGANNGITRNLFTVDDHAYYTKGKHSLEAGVWVQRLQSNDNLAQDQYGQASFASLSTFLTGTIKTFTYAPQTTELGWRTLFVNAFIEDVYHIAPRLEARVGFRSESSTGWSESQNRAGVYTFSNGVISSTPTILGNAITNNRAIFLPEPRIGLAWNVFGSGRTSVTAGAGLHHSLLDALDYRLDQAAPFNTVYSYSSSPIATPTSPTPQVSPSTVDSGIATPALLAYNLKIEQQIAPSTSLSVGYDGSHSYHQILNGDLNEPAYTVLANGTIYYLNTTKANTAVANTTSWWAGGSGNFNALIVDVRHDLAHGLQLRGNFTWAKNLDDGSAWNTSVSSNTPAFVEVPSLPHLDYGPAATDIRRAAAINATYELPFGAGKTLFANDSHAAEALLSGWSLSSISNVFSGFHFSPQLGYNPTGSGDSRNPVRPNLNASFTGPLYPGGNTAARVAEFFNPNAFSPPAYGTVGNAGRDSLVGPAYADWDVSLLKSTQVTERLHVQFRAEFFNVLNHTNLQLPNEVVYSAGPTQGTTANQTTAAAFGSPGVISATANTSRQIQLGLKILF
ncbi:MAG: carboxypeptidase-like regulatory domain-containing protein [Terracidiphilus sp.]